MIQEQATFKKTDLALEDFFDGSTVACGLFEDRFGTVRNEFTVQINGSWDGKYLTLDEDFHYSDGSEEQRQWVIEKTGPNSYRGKTDDVVGSAEGSTEGNSFHWQYFFNLKVGEKTWKVRFDDWMFLLDENVLLNKATVSRWGVKIGTVFISFHRKPDAVEARAAVEAAE